MSASSSAMDVLDMGVIVDLSFFVPSTFSSSNRFGHIESILVSRTLESVTAADTNDWGECKHQPYHHAGKVACDKRIDDYKHMFIMQFFEAEDNTCREEEHKEIKIHEKRTAMQ